MPLAFVALASSAVKIIKESCELYKEGRQIVTDIAHEVDGVVKDVKTVQESQRSSWVLERRIWQERGRAATSCSTRQEGQEKERASSRV